MQVLQRCQMTLVTKTMVPDGMVVVPRAAHRAHIAHGLARASLEAITARRPLALCPQAAVMEARETANASTFMSLMDLEEGEEGYEEEDEIADRIEVEADESLKIANLGLCDETVRALTKRDITALFAIQKAVFQPAADGRDMIGRAKTGSGKTLAFALPVVESLLEENRRTPAKRGRLPRCIVLAPTRELANQVAREFESVCPSLVVASFYGGVSAGPQMRSLMTGVDVAVGTPGRIQDLIERRCLKLDQVRFAILDEADQMLDMGFEEDMERILKLVPPERQTLLFSATLPTWVNKVAKKYLKNPLLVDLVGEANTGKLAETIRLMVLQVESSHKHKALLDLLSLYGAGAGTIVFVNTKRMADELQSQISETQPCEALHGDITQGAREQALKEFRAGKFSVLVATDVAARGLDIQNVDLVVHYDMPQDNEAFLHRSGRTGRAGKEGTAVIMYSDREARGLAQLFKDTKVVDVELVGSADPADVMTSASRTVLTKLDKVTNQVIDFFVPAAERLLASEQPTRVLAAALASMSGFRAVPKPRSLLTYEENMVTLRLTTAAGLVDGWSALTRTLGTLTKKAAIKIELDQQIGKMKLLGAGPDGREAAAFDLPMAAATKLMSCAPLAETMGLMLDRPKTLKVNAFELLGSAGSSSRGRSGYGDRGSSRGSSRSGGGSGYGRDSYSSRSSGGSRDSYSSSGRGGSGGYGGGASSGGGYISGGGGGYGASSERSSARGGWDAAAPSYSRGGGSDASSSSGRGRVGRETESWGSSAAPRAASPYGATAARGRASRLNDDDISAWDSASGWDESAVPAPRKRLPSATRNAAPSAGNDEWDAPSGASSGSKLMPRRRAASSDRY